MPLSANQTFLKTAHNTLFIASMSFAHGAYVGVAEHVRFPIFKLHIKYCLLPYPQNPNLLVVSWLSYEPAYSVSSNI